MKSDDAVKSDDDDAVKSDDDAVKWGVGTAARVMIDRLAERHLLTMYAMLRFLHKIQYILLIVAGAADERKALCKFIEYVLCVLTKLLVNVSF